MFISGRCQRARPCRPRELRGLRRCGRCRRAGRTRGRGGGRRRRPAEPGRSRLRLHVREAVGEADALGAAVLRLVATAADHERHLGVPDHRSQRPGVELAAALALCPPAVYPQPDENAGEANCSADDRGTDGHRSAHRPRPWQDGQLRFRGCSPAISSSKRRFVGTTRRGRT